MADNTLLKYPNRPPPLLLEGSESPAVVLVFSWDDDFPLYNPATEERGTTISVSRLTNPSSDKAFLVSAKCQRNAISSKS